MKSLQNLQKPLPKKLDVNIPNCVNDSELVRFYEQTDLEFTFVYECAKSLKPLKGIDVNLQQVEFWYREFLRMGWKKKDFDKQFEAIKRAALYNRIDLENWLSTEVMYNEIDFNVGIQRAVDAKIQRGNYLKDKKAELSEADKKVVDLAMAKEVELKYKTGFYEARESYASERKKIWEKKFKVDDNAL